MTNKPPDCAWNDPPQLDYSRKQTQSKRNELNQRVAFDFNASLQNTVITGSTSGNLPKLESTETSFVQSESSEATNKEIDIEVEDEAKYSSAIDILFKLANENEESFGTKNRSIQNKLMELKNSWSDLNSIVKKKLYFLTECLNDDEFDLAFEVVSELSVGHWRQVKGWILAIKHIIVNRKANHEALILKAEQDSKY